MKFLVLALCVCAASAAYTPFSPTTYNRYNPVVPARAVAQAVVENVAAPVVAPVVAAAKVVSAAAKNYNTEADAVVLRSETDVRPDGYNYAYETANGIAGESNAVLKRVGDADVLAVQGSYRYTAPDGTPVLLTYTADENGYQPQSDLLPVAPPVPEAIVRSIAYTAARSAQQVEKRF